MKPLSNIGIFLDLSDADEFLLRYFKKLDDVFNFDSLTLVHFVPLDTYSEDLASLAKQLPKPLEEILADETQELVVKVFGEEKSSVSVKIQMGGKLDDLIKWVDSKSFNLVVLGKKSKVNGTGIFSSKVIRLTDSDCLFVPEDAKTEFESILLALDFSAYSEKVIFRGINLARNLKSELLPVHVLRTGIQYLPFFKNQTEFHKSLKKKAEASFKKLQKKSGLKQDLTLLEEEESHISISLHEYAERQSANLIILGNKGKADEDDLLIGSVAERLIFSEKKIPMLIVKNN